MKDHDVLRAIANLEHVGVPIANELHVLNDWRERIRYLARSSSSFISSSTLLRAART
jgi:hypothetical protein